MSAILYGGSNSHHVTQGTLALILNINNMELLLKICLFLLCRKNPVIWRNDIPVLRVESMVPG